MPIPPGLTENPWKLAYDYNFDSMVDLMYERWVIDADYEVVRLASRPDSICLYILTEKDLP